MSSLEDCDRLLGEMDKLRQRMNMVCHSIRSRRKTLIIRTIHKQFGAINVDGNKFVLRKYKIHDQARLEDSVVNMSNEASAIKNDLELLENQFDDNVVESNEEKKKEREEALLEELNKKPKRGRPKKKKEEPFLTYDTSIPITRIDKPIVVSWN
jgi:thioester reductase-like protein